MAGGQAIDLQALGKQLNLAEMEDMHIHKTGAIIRSSILFAAYAAKDIEETHIQSLDHFAKCIGLAYQIQDDILDVEGNTAILGKNSGADSANNKPTYPSMLGMSEAKKRNSLLYEEAMETINKIPYEFNNLKTIVTYIFERNY